MSRAGAPSAGRRQLFTTRDQSLMIGEAFGETHIPKQQNNQKREHNHGKEETR
jgi:hypothetical protein